MTAHSNVHDVSRRHFVKSSGLLLSFVVAGKTVLLTPAQAHARGLSYQFLEATEVDTVQALADALVPGAKEAGIAHFLDTQLAAEPQQSLIMLKYLGVAPEGFQGFYRGALASITKAVSKHFKAAQLSALSAEQLQSLLALMAKDEIEDWQAAPASFFMFVLRADACDVVYGTTAGQEKLNFPQMAHIKPEQEW